MIIEELTTVLGLQIEDRGLEQFKSSLLITAGRLALVTAGAVAAAAAVYSVFSAVASAAKEVSDSAKLARNLGTTSQELQRFGQVAESVGLPIAALQGIVESLRENLLKVASGENAEFELKLGKMGLSARDASGKIKDAIPLLKEISDVIANAGDLQDFRLGQAMGLGGIGVSATEFLKLGSEEIDRRGSAFKVLSDKDIDRFEKLTAILQRLKNVAETFGLKLASPIAGFMNEVLGALEKAANSPYFDKVVEQFEKISKAAGNFYAKTMDAALPQLEKVQKLSEDIVKKAFGVNELSGGQTAIAMLLTGMLSMTPQGPAAAADVQDYLSGKGDTKTEAELKFFSEFLRGTVDMANFLGGWIPGVGRDDQPAPATSVGSFGRSEIHIHNENHFAPGTDVQGAMRDLDRSNAEQVREAVDDPRRRVSK